jgi:L-ascorbate metabolism protein UlaG (beta-lactamase superfamily)
VTRTLYVRVFALMPVNLQRQVPDELRFARLSTLCLLAVLCTGCATRSPVAPHMVMSFTNAARFPFNRAADTNVLQVQWLGTACYLLQLGDQAILTDPFYSHHSLARVAFGGLKSNPHIVSNALASLPVPKAIFVGHSHYDHLLDAAQSLSQPGWGGISIYGSETTRNILHGYGRSFTNTWRLVETDSEWHTVSPGIRYKAVSATHGRQLPLLPLLYPGQVKDPRAKEPRSACDFRVGDCYALLFELSNAHVTYKIYFIGAPHGGDEPFPRNADPVDVAILCVPTWNRSKGYPDNIIHTLKPRHIVASHFNNFFQVNDKPPEIVALADLDGFLLRAQNSASHPGFESIVVPPVGSLLLFQPAQKPRP